MDKKQKPAKYQFNRLVFWINSSLFLAQLVSQHHARVHKGQYPRAAEVILKSTYMDDSMESVRTEAERIKLFNELFELWSKAGPACTLTNGCQTL